MKDFVGKMGNTTRDLFLTLKDRGPLGAAGYLFRQARRFSNQVLNAYYERTFGVDVGPIKPWPYPSDDPDCGEYAPISYEALRRLIKHARPITAESVFLDLGCGLGRPLLVAGRLSFARVIGVELSPDLAARARENAAGAAKKLRCKNIEIVTADATGYRIPPDVTHILMVAPFAGRILRRVMENIRQSLEAHPRQLKIMWRHNTHWTESLGERDWLTPVYEFRTYDGGCGVVLKSEVVRSATKATSAGPRFVRDNAFADVDSGV